MQQKLEELCQIETVLLLETVNVSYLSQEHQVCSNAFKNHLLHRHNNFNFGEITAVIVKIVLQDVQVKSMEVVKKTLIEDEKEKMSAEEYVKQKRTWEIEMERVRAQLHNSQMVGVIIK